MTEEGKVAGGMTVKYEGKLNCCPFDAEVHAGELKTRYGLAAGVAILCTDDEGTWKEVVLELPAALLVPIGTDEADFIFSTLH